MQEQNEKQVIQEQEEEVGYTPRPTWQRVIAGVLAAIVIVGLIGYYYWIAHRY